MFFVCSRLLYYIIMRLTIYNILNNHCDTCLTASITAPRDNWWEVTLLGYGWVKTTCHSSDGSFQWEHYCPSLITF